MRKLLALLLASSLWITPYKAVYADDLDRLGKETDQLWRRGKGAEDGAFTSMATSMLAWGVGIGVVAALLAILIDTSTASSSHNHCH